MRRCFEDSEITRIADEEVAKVWGDWAEHLPPLPGVGQRFQHNGDIYEVWGYGGSTNHKEIALRKVG